MTATPPGPSDRDAAEASFRWRPEEGWSVLALVIVLGLVLATAIDEPAWVNGQGSLTDSLAWCAAGGAVVGFAGPKLGWGRWTTHLVGALAAAVALPVVAGWAVMPGLSAAQAFRFTAEGTVQAYLDLTVRGYQFTTQEVHYVLALSGLVWGTMQFGSYAVFGHRRPLSAVVVIGLVLLGNMALTTRDQLGWLVLYVAVSLFLLVQMHVVGERGTWARRRVGDPGAVALLYLRGGAVFIVGATAVSVVLAQGATSSPLAGAWRGLDSEAVRIAKQIGPLLPAGGDVRGSGVAFGSTAQVVSQWVSDPGVAFTAQVPPEAAGLKFRAATYDEFALGGWVQSETRAASAAAGADLLDGSPEIPAPGLEDQLSVTIAPAGYHDTALLSPGLAQSVSLPSSLAITGLQGWFADDTVAADTPYQVTALVPRLGEDGGITQSKLRAAPTAYPPDVSAEYTQVPAGAIGPHAAQLLATILARSPSRNPYDLASTMETYLRSAAFTYTTDVRGLDCASPSAVECFAQYRQGYCLHYASTMAILLRAANPADPIPTRLVQGFLPSDIVNGRETVENRQAHAWVEVYFPGYGWIPFDPTGGGVGQPVAIPVGPPVAAPSGPAASEGPETAGTAQPTRRVFEPREPAGGGAAGSASRPADATVAVLLGALLVLALGALAVVAWWRGVRVAVGPVVIGRGSWETVSPDVAWTAMAASASRFGFAPRPTETVYEYAASLAELVPVARPDIVTIADAKVETTYARAVLAPEREHAVAAAGRRLRVALLRLLFSRRRWRRR